MRCACCRAIFIARPRLAAVISVVITLAGLISLAAIPIAQFPDIVPPQIAVTANYAGASAEVVESTVAQPIESRVIGVDNMIYMKSTSGADGSYSLTVTFKVGTDPDLNTVKVQNRVSLAEPQLPQEVRNQGISVTKKSSALLQVLALVSPDGRYDQLFLSNYATINIIDALKRVPGIGDVSLFTPADYSMRVWLDTDRLTSFGLTPSDIANAVKRQNTQAAVGRIGAQPALPDQQFQLTIQTKGRLSTVEEFGNIVVRANPDGSFVRVRDVARVELAARTSESIGRQDGGPATVIGLYQSPGGNALDSANGVRRILDQLKRSFPEGLDYKITYDTSLLRQAEPGGGAAHPGRGVHPGRDRGVPVSRQLPCDADPADRRAGGADRHLRGHAGAGLQRQHGVAARPRARDRHRGRRRDRGGGGGRGAAREGPFALARPRRRAAPWARSPRRSSRSRSCCCRCSCRSRSFPASRASCSASSRSLCRSRW